MRKKSTNRGRPPHQRPAELQLITWDRDDPTREYLQTDQERRIWDLQERIEDLRRDAAKARQQEIFERNADTCVQERESRQLQALDDMVAAVYPYRGRPGQLHALRWLVFEENDLILIAKTSFGKSMIMQIMPCLLRSSAVLIILPLNAIGVEQLAKIKAIPGMTPVHVTRETVSKELIDDIRNAKYSHILMSPEQAVARRFHKVFTDPKFRSRLQLVVIDEAHLIANWGLSFRDAYTKLFKLRTLLGPKPWFACTATLDDDTFKMVRELAVFKGNFKVIQTSIDRPEISIIREWIKQGDTKTYGALYFVVDSAYEEVRERPSLQTESPSHSLRYQSTPQRVPKTVIFMDSKAEIAVCRDTIRTWLRARGYSKAAAKATVQMYHSSLAEDDKTQIYGEFTKSDSKIRVLICSDAVAQGADIADITRVVIYRIPRDRLISLLWQKFGRAARGSGMKGQAILLLEAWAKGSRSTPGAQGAVNARDLLQRTAVASALRSRVKRPSQLSREYRPDNHGNESGERMDIDSDSVSIASTENTENMASNTYEIAREHSPGGTTVHISADVSTRKQRRKTHAEKRADLPDALYKLANTDGCLREVFLLSFNEDLAPDDTKVPVDREHCCSNCNSNLGAYKKLDICTTRQLDQRMQQERKEMATKLRAWLANWVRNKYAHAVWIACPEHVVPDEVLREICRKAELIDSRESLKTNLPEWDYDCLGEDIDSFIAVIRQQTAGIITEDMVRGLTCPSSPSGARVLRWAPINTPSRGVRPYMTPPTPPSSQQHGYTTSRNEKPPSSHPRSKRPCGPSSFTIYQPSDTACTSLPPSQQNPHDNMDIRLPYLPQDLCSELSPKPQEPANSAITSSIQQAQVNERPNNQSSKFLGQEYSQEGTEEAGKALRVTRIAREAERSRKRTRDDRIGTMTRSPIVVERDKGVEMAESADITERVLSSARRSPLDRLDVASVINRQLSKSA